MDYLNEFKRNCEFYISQKSVEVSNAHTKDQRITEFERELKRLKKEINLQLIDYAESYLKKAQADEYLDFNELETKMKFLILGLLRQYEDDQKDKSGGLL